MVKAIYCSITLEGVYAGDLHLLVEFCVEGSLVLHVGDQEGPLSLVGSDDPDLVGLDPRPDEHGGQLLHVGGFTPVQVGGPVRGNLLLPGAAKEQREKDDQTPNTIFW